MWVRDILSLEPKPPVSWSLYQKSVVFVFFIFNYLYLFPFYIYLEICRYNRHSRGRNRRQQLVLHKFKIKHLVLFRYCIILGVAFLLNTELWVGIPNFAFPFSQHFLKTAYNYSLHVLLNGYFSFAHSKLIVLMKYSLQQKYT